MKRALFILFLPFIVCEDGPTLSLKAGEILGHYKTSRNGKIFAAYEGVPYAQPPLGDLRWKPAVPAQPWEGILNCTTLPPMCSQTSAYNVYPNGAGQEDCLYLNVYHPLDSNVSSNPIMVWIHGGGFLFGSGSFYGPEFLMDEGVVLITINYRLGVFGFLSLDTPQFSGNQGIRDQTLALKWVQENFGPATVTIFGESAGSWSISHHILSPQSEGLFQAAIGQSGTMDDGVAFRPCSREEALERTKTLAIAANCFDGSAWDATAVLDCLRKKTGPELIDLAHQHFLYNYKMMPNVDDISEDGPILPDMPEQLLKFGLFNQVPVIWGTNLGEGSVFFPFALEDPSLLDTYDAVWAEYGTNLIFLRDPEKNGTDFGPHDVEIAMAARDFYFDGKVSGEKLPSFVDLMTDAYILRPIHNMALAMSDFVPVYQYLFTFRDETSYTGTPGPPNLSLGPTHWDEIPYLFQYTKDVSIQVDYDGWSQKNMENSLRMCKMWTNFAKEMNPTPGDGLGVTWERVSRDEHMYLNIGEELVMDMDDQYKQRMAFWDQVPMMGKI